MAVLSPHLYRSNSYALRPRRVTWVKTKREGVKSGHSGAFKPDKLGLSCKANKCSDAGTGDLGVLLTHEISPRSGVYDSTRRKYKYKVPD